MPRPPSTAVVVGGLDGWRAALAAAGTGDGAPPDLAVASADDVDEAIATGAGMVILEGGGGLASLERSGFAARRYLTLPRPDRPTAFVPIGDPDAVVLWRALGSMSTPRRVARATVASAAAAGRRMPGLATITVAARDAGPPFALAAAAERGLLHATSWILLPGSDAGEHKRNVFRVPAQGSAPGYVLKIARVPGERTASDRDDAGIRLVQSFGPIAAGHAPRPVGRFEVGGFDALVETEAGRAPISALLSSRVSRRRKLAAIEAVAGWLAQVGGATRTSPAVRRHAWEWMASETAVPWPAFGAPADLFERIDDVPGVLQHGDLWVGNVLSAAGGGFGVVDWELARPAGIPLGDLVLFLPDALALVDGARSERARLAHFISLFRGDLRSSRALFGLVADAAATCSLEPRHVGALVTIATLESGIPPWYDRHELPVAAMPLRARLARAWLDEPGLGPDWPAWVASLEGRRLRR